MILLLTHISTLSKTEQNAKISGESNRLGIFRVFVSEFLAHSKLDTSQTGVVIIAYLELVDCPTHSYSALLSPTQPNSAHKSWKNRAGKSANLEPPQPSVRRTSAHCTPMKRRRSAKCTWWCKSAKIQKSSSTHLWAPQLWVILKNGWQTVI